MKRIKMCLLVLLIFLAGCTPYGKNETDSDTVDERAAVCDQDTTSDNGGLFYLKS